MNSTQSQAALALPRTRPPVAGRNGAVASAHPLASLAGLDMLRQGGNAVDAAVAMAVTLAVVEPYMSGPGGVGFLILSHADGRTDVLNFSGTTPAAATCEQFTPATQERGPRASLVPGNVAGWFEALGRAGRLPAGEVFAPAVRLAREGFPLHPANVRFIEAARPRLDAAAARAYGDVPLRIGAILTQPELAGTLELLAGAGPDEFYRGPLAGRIAECVQSQGGFLSLDDLTGYEPEWGQPVAAAYRGCEVRTCPPNSEGFQILQTLRLLEAFDLASLGHNSAQSVHVVSEAVKLAAADRIRWGGDPKFHPVPLDRLLGEDYIADRRRVINFSRASQSEGERWRGPRSREAVAPGHVDGLTTHLAAVDRDGTVASITQSLGSGFGSGVMVPGTGLLLNNFVWWTEIDPACPTPNRLAPGKRWSCCLAPTHVFRDGRCWFSMATPGSYGILHTTVQMLLNVIDFGADVQSAIEAPRFRVWEDTRMQIETRVPADVREELSRRGHALEPVGDYSALVGGGQAVMIDPASGARLAGADPRRDGYALAY
ncbi:MAG TPA: gamma-glutamyltransferase [Planctomycetaceae bacterium]|nr:gamma-glutamyltransferase [Planctomycetaceae bacterium]